MTASVETRPERALYNVGVALRLVDQLLAEVGATYEAADANERDMADRVAHALMLAESLEAENPSPRRHLNTQLRGTLRSLLVDLERSLGPTPRRAH